MKSKFSILFIFIMSVLTAGSCMLAGAETQVYSEAGLTYTVNSDSTATVTGFSGEVIENLTIPESLGGYTVSKIGNNSFKGKGIQSLTLPETVKTIEYNAFTSCTELKTIIFNEGLTELQGYAFSYCSSLSKITLPSTLKTVNSNGVFYNCTNLTKVNFAEGTEVVPSYICYRATALEEVVLPESVTTIGRNAFCDCTSLMAIDLHEGIVKMEANAFMNCTSLTEVTLPSTLKYANYYPVFYGCTNITKVVFAGGTTATADYACKGMTSLTEVVLPETVTKIGEASFNNCTSLSAINLPEGITQLGGYAFSNCTSLTEVTFPSTLKSANYNASFYGCTNITKVVFAEGTTTTADYACKGMTSLTEVVLPETVTTIGTGTFSGCTQLDMEIPAAVTKIGQYAFSNCVSIKNVEFNEGLLTIGNGAFENCSQLTEIHFPSTMKDEFGLCNSAPFKGCLNITTVSFEDGLTKIPNYICLGMTGLKDVTIPESVKAIGFQSFMNCTSLETIKLPIAVEDIDDYAFESCISLKEIQLHEGLQVIGSAAFKYCNSLTQVTIPSTLKDYDWFWGDGFGAFAGSAKLETIIFSDGISAVPARFCTDLKSLKNVVLPESVKTIGDKAFARCPALESMELNEGITTIGGEAFLNCTSLTEITFPSTLKTVSTNAVFTGCTKLTKVIFAEGTEKIADNVCKSAPAITHIVIPDTVKEIGNNAFANCITLRTIDLNKVEALSSNAFSECTGLSVVTVPETLQYVNGTESPFNGCSNITSIIFEGSTIPPYFCRNMAALHTIDMKNGLTAVGNNAFYAVNNLKTFIIRDRSCAIPDAEGTIVSGATIYGYEPSTAKDYADKYNRSFVPLAAADNYEATVEYVRRQMINRNRYIILSYPQDAPELTGNNDFVKFFDAVFAYDKADSAAGDNLRWSVKKVNRAVLDDGYLVLDVDYYTTAEQENLLADKLTEIAQSLRLNDQPEYEKARLIFEYLCDNANAVSPNDKAYSNVHHSAYSVLVNNSGVCEGFSLAFYRLALEAGLDARVVVNDKLLHACNIVSIADQWYYIDAYLAADEGDSSRGDVFYFLKSSVESQFSGEDYIAFTPVYETEANWALTPAEIEAYSFAESDYIVDGGCSHIMELVGYSGQPCSGTGKEEYKCPKCGNEFSRSCRLEHSAISDSIRCQWCDKNLCKHEEQYKILMPEQKATCTEDGRTSYEYCSYCEEHYFCVPELIPATGHSDKDNDGVCDQCGTTVGKKENSFIAKIKEFFGKISRFLARLLGKKK